MAIIKCTQCNNGVSDKAIQCPKCGMPVSTNNHQQMQMSGNSDDKPHSGWNILGFIIPIVGVILYFAWKKETPKKANSILYCSIAGFIFGLFLQGFIQGCTEALFGY